MATPLNANADVRRRRTHLPLLHRGFTQNHSPPALGGLPRIQHHSKRDVAPRVAQKAREQMRQTIEKGSDSKAKARRVVSTASTFHYEPMSKRKRWRVTGCRAADCGVCSLQRHAQVWRQGTKRSRAGCACARHRRGGRQEQGGARRGATRSARRAGGARAKEAERAECARVRDREAKEASRAGRGGSSRLARLQRDEGAAALPAAPRARLPTVRLAGGGLSSGWGSCRWPRGRARGAAGRSFEGATYTGVVVDTLTGRRRRRRRLRRRRRRRRGLRWLRPAAQGGGASRSPGRYLLNLMSCSRTTGGGGGERRAAAAAAAAAAERGAPSSEGRAAAAAGDAYMDMDMDRMTRAPRCRTAAPEEEGARPLRLREWLSRPTCAYARRPPSRRA